MHGPRSPLHRRCGSRAALLTAVVATSCLIGATAARASDGLIIPLDPPEVEVFLLPAENFTDLPIPDDPAQLDVAPVDVAWGGSLLVRLPAGIDASSATVSLALGSADDESPTRTLSSDPGDPDPLAVAQPDDRTLAVTLPADDGVDGPLGLLEVDGLAGTDDGTTVDPLDYLLQFSGSGAATATLQPLTFAMDSVPCALSSDEDCPPYSVTAGDSIGFTVPAGSRLRTLGFGRLADLHVGTVSLDEMQSLDSAEDPAPELSAALAPALAGAAQPSGESPAAAMAPARALAEALAVPGDLVQLAEDGQLVTPPANAGDPTGDEAAPARVAAAAPPPTTDSAAGSSPDSASTTGGLLAGPIPGVNELPVAVAGGRATVRIPKDTAPGTYGVILVDGAEDQLSDVPLTFLTLEVSAPPAPPAPPAPKVVNTGLRSETDWTEARTPAPSGSPLVGLGAGALGAAALGTAAMFRPWRRRPRER